MGPIETRHHGNVDHHEMPQKGNHKTNLMSSQDFVQRYSFKLRALGYTYKSYRCTYRVQK